MPLSARSQATASAVILLGLVLLFFFEPPFIANVVFVVLCITWAGWIFIAVLRGPDELQSASVRYGLAMASVVGVPACLVFVNLMIATPDLQGALTRLHSVSGSGLTPAPFGFALGVTFMVIVLCILCAAGSWIWWARRR